MVYPPPPMVNNAGAAVDRSNVTSVSLLERAVGRDETAWARLATLYSPLVAHWCKSGGVPPADVDDVTQEVLVAVSLGLPRFRRERDGGFRAWVRGIARHKILDRLRQARRGEPEGGTDAHRRVLELPDAADGPGDDEAGEEAWLYRRALDLVRTEFADKTWQAFWRVAVDDRPTDAVAVELGMSAVAVRIAKSRVLARLREEVGDLIG
jgi:RNA polymerase sigma-70 factor (ECF subfamily)